MRDEFSYNCAMLRIYLLGAPTVERDGQTLETDTRKATALLAYLAITATPHTRDELAALLWPEFSQEKSRAALRRTLSVLKKAIGPECMVITRESLAIVPEQVWVDALVFGRKTTTIAQLEAAVSLYRADFMTGFTLRDAPPFDDWVYYQSEQYRRAFAQVLERLIAHHEAFGEFESALALAQRYLALDPLHEAAHRKLMRIYAWNGARNAALQQYLTCVRILDDELGVAPLDETRELYEQIRLGALEAPDSFMAIDAPSAAAETPPPQGAAPLVGRAVEWHQLLTAYTAASTGNGVLVAVTGEPGIGKTRLSAEFCDWAAEQGSVILPMRCYEGAVNLSYEPFAGGLRHALQQQALRERLDASDHVWLSELSRLLPEVGGWWPQLLTTEPSTGVGSQTRFFEAIVWLCDRLCHSEHPSIIWIDDVQWADTASQELLAYLVRRLPQRVVLLLSWRDAELDSDHILRTLPTATRRVRSVHALELNRLSAADVATLVLASGIDANTEQLVAVSEGVPFIVVEYLAMLQHGHPVADEMPPSVRDLLTARLIRLGQTQRQILQSVALIGRAAPYELLRHVSGRSEDETVAALETLLALQLLRETTDAAALVLDFSHHMLRDLVYAEISLVRRRLLHRRVADQLIDQSRRLPQPGSLAAQIGTHLQYAGQDAQAAEYFLQAGDFAVSLFANRDALAGYKRALALGHPQTTQLHIACGDLYVRQGAYDEALASYITAASHLDGLVSAEIAFKLGQVYRRRGEWDVAERQFATAYDLWRDVADAAALAQLCVAWSQVALRRNDLSRASTLSAEAAAWAEQSQSIAVQARCANLQGILSRREHQSESAETHLRHSLTLAQSLHDLDLQIAARNNLALVERDRGAVDAAMQHVQKALELCQTYGDRHHEAALRNNLADLLHLAGQTEDAREQVRLSAQIYSDIGGDGPPSQPEIWMLAEW